MILQSITEYQVLTCPSIQKQAAYELALVYLDALENDPRTGRLSRNLYNLDGELLVCLDEVVRACESRQLAGLDEAAANGDFEEA